MKVWKHTPLDAILLALSVGHLVAALLFAAAWDGLPLVPRLGGFALLVSMTVYQVIVVTHLFTHAPWFESRALDALASMVNSANIGRSAQAYRLTHVRNHHRYNNDRQDSAGQTDDLSSTFKDGKDGEHAPLFRYAFLGALSTLVDVSRTLLSVRRLWGVGRHERELLDLVSAAPDKRARELGQVRLDRAAHFLLMCLFIAISWRWTLFCYLPAFFLTLVLVNMQNYYEHYGAEPDSRYTDSVSYYGRLYNFLTFNDGYHQEHHLRPGAHWSGLPEVRLEYQERLDEAERVVSPVPAILGFLHRGRPLLHRTRDHKGSTPADKGRAVAADA